jgi:hypothetical protein
MDSIRSIADSLLPELNLMGSKARANSMFVPNSHGATLDSSAHRCSSPSLHATPSSSTNVMNQSNLIPELAKGHCLGDSLGLEPWTESSSSSDTDESPDSFHNAAATKYAKKDDATESNDDLDKTFQEGDLVQIHSPGDYFGMRGYIMAETKYGSYRIAIDKCHDNNFCYIQKETAILNANDITLIRKHATLVYFDIGNSISLSFPTGEEFTLYSLPDDEIRPVDTGSPFKTLTRTHIMDLPPYPESPLFVFKNDDEKKLYDLFFGGNFCAAFKHQFDEPNKISTATPSSNVVLFAKNPQEGPFFGILEVHYNAIIKGDQASARCFIGLCHDTKLDLTTEQSKALLARTAHLLIRSFGQNLGFCNVCSLVSCTNWYENNGRHVDLIDALTAAADVALHTGLWRRAMRLMDVTRLGSPAMSAWPIC